MKLTPLSILLIVLLSFLQNSCVSKKKQDPYKEGDIVTWKINDHLILKAEVGERREHFVTHNERVEREFYRPQYERYIGQFPLDYQPVSFDTINEAEAKDMPISKTSGGGYEFNLMLNGSWVQASDRVVESNDTLDHPDQVKVVVKPYRSPEGKDSKQFFESNYNDKLDLASLTSEDGLSCYKFSNARKGRMCFGQSLNNKISGFDFYLSPNNDTSILVRSQESIYAGIMVEWTTHQNNLAQVQIIDNNIWRLLDTWNISPFTNSAPVIENLKGS